MANPALIGDLESNQFNIRLRYHLLPLYYSLAHHAARTGNPILTPLFVKYPDDMKARNVGNQYFIGPITAAFVDDENVNNTNIYLPEGTQWFFLFLFFEVV